MKETKKERIPEFKTLEEEREYWEARGPLAEGHKGTINKPKSRQKRSSFLAVRLTGEELTKLRDIAAKQGLGPSTFARIILASVIDKDKSHKRIPVSDFIRAMSSRFSLEDIEKLHQLFKDIAIGDPENPALLVYSGERKKWEEFSSLFFERMFGIKIVQTEDKNFRRVKEIIEK